MSADGPPRGARPPRGAASEARFGGITSSADGPPRGARPPRGAASEARFGGIATSEAADAVVDIRRLAPGDIDAYRALRLRGLAEHPEAFTSDAGEEAAKPRDALAKRLAPDPSRPHDAVFGAFDGATLVGVCGLDVDMRAKLAHKGHVFGMYVPAERAGRGIGGALMDAVIAHAAARPGLRQLVLTVTAGNVPARRVYERAGFAVCGREPHAIRVGGHGHDKLTMVHFLPAARAPRP